MSDQLRIPQGVLHSFDTSAATTGEKVAIDSTRRPCTDVPLLISSNNNSEQAITTSQIVSTCAITTENVKSSQQNVSDNFSATNEKIIRSPTKLRSPTKQRNPERRSRNKPEGQTRKRSTAKFDCDESSLSIKGSRQRLNSSHDNTAKSIADSEDQSVIFSRSLPKQRSEKSEILENGPPSETTADEINAVSPDKPSKFETRRAAYGSSGNNKSSDDRPKALRIDRGGNDPLSPRTSNKDIFIENIYSTDDAAFGAPLKVDPSKFVVKARFGQKDMILKIAIGQGAMIIPNIVASRFIQKLQIDGITAPEMHFCSLKKDSFINLIDDYKKAALGTQLEKTAKWNADDLMDGFSRCDSDTDPNRLRSNSDKDSVFNAALVSERAPGYGVDYLAEAATVVELLVPAKWQQACDGLPKEWKSLSEFLLSRPAKKKGADFDIWLARADTLVDELKTDDGGLFKSNLIMHKLKLQLALAPMGAPKAKIALSDIDNIKTFKKWLNSDKGKDALINLACIDCILGMEDRLIQKFHGGNFMFDGKQFICIDNAKIGPHLGAEFDEYKTFVDYEDLASVVAKRLNTIIEGKNGSGLNKIIATSITPERVKKMLIEIADKSIQAARSFGHYEAARRIIQRAEYIKKILQSKDEQKY